MIFAVRASRWNGAGVPSVDDEQAGERDRVRGLQEQRALPVEEADRALLVHAPQDRLAGREVAGVLHVGGCYLRARSDAPRTIVAAVSRLRSALADERSWRRAVFAIAGARAACCAWRSPRSPAAATT